jgi:hypothetical protein
MISRKAHDFNSLHAPDFRSVREAGHDDLPTCIHEAAHAVSFIAFKWRFDIVSIEPLNDMIGYVFGDFPSDHPHVPVMFLSGCVAEARYTGLSVDDLLDAGGQADLQFAQEALAKAYAPQSLEQVIICTKRLVAFNWYQIETLAYYLQQRKTMSWDETLRLLV